MWLVCKRGRYDALDRLEGEEEMGGLGGGGMRTQGNKKTADR